MPTKKSGKKVKTTRPSYIESEQISEPLSTPQDTPVITNAGTKKPVSWYVGIGIIVLALIGLVLFRRGWIVAASVDGSPIFTWDVVGSMLSRFGKQTVEGLVTERLISQAAQKAGVTVSQEEIDARTLEVTKNIGGNVKLEDLLRYQGITKTDFDKQMRLQISVEKVLGKDLEVTDTDVTNFIATNRAVLVATEEAALKSEAKKAILDKEIGAKIQPWFAKLKEGAKITTFLQ